MRHGKSYKDSTIADQDRPLKDKGKRSAQRMGLWLLKNGLIPDRILTSPVERALVSAQKTCKVMNKSLNAIVVEDQVYHAGPKQLVDLLQKTPESTSRVLLVGHNPALTQLIESLCDISFDKSKGKTLPPAALACLSIPCAWSGLKPAAAQLISITKASNLPKKFPFPDHTSEELRDRPAYYYRQSAVIPYRISADRIEILIISSSKQKHWVVPKGIKEPELSPQESAAHEALEEAGIEGVVDPLPLGSYSYLKWGSQCRVEVYSMRVSHVIAEEQWEESHRGRRWVSPEEAKSLIREKAYCPMIEQLSALVTAQSGDPKETHC